MNAHHPATTRAPFRQAVAPDAADPPPWTARIPRNWVYGAHPMRRTTARSVLVLFALSLTACEPPAVSPTPVMVIARDANGQRSEERRVGKECKERGSLNP